MLWQQLELEEHQEQGFPGEGKLIGGISSTTGKSTLKTGGGDSGAHAHNVVGLKK